MADHNPFLFVHLPLDEIQRDRLLDTSPNRRHATARQAQIKNDDTFGACLELTGEHCYVELPPWKPLAVTSQKLTFSIWISVAAGDGDSILIDSGLHPEMERLKVSVRRSGQTWGFSVLAPGDRHKVSRWSGEANLHDAAWVHFAFVWDAKEDCRMFVDGRRLAGSSRRESEALPRHTAPRTLQTFLGWPAFRGKLAHFRIYTQELAEQELSQDIGRDLSRAAITEPLACSLLNPNGHPTMDLDASDLGEKMQFIARPLRGEITPSIIPYEPPSPDRNHFVLAFRGGTLDLSRGVEARPTIQNSWEAKAYPGYGGEDLICLRCNAPSPFPADGLKIVLFTLKADQRFGPRSAPIEIRYTQLKNGRGQLMHGRVRQWLSLQRSALPGGLATALSPIRDDWTQVSVFGPSVLGGMIRLGGQLFAADAQALIKKAFWHILFTASAAAPFGGSVLRFPGRVRWLAAAGASGLETQWLSDVMISGGGEVGIDAGLPSDVLASVGRIEIDLDGVSYF